MQTVVTLHLPSKEALSSFISFALKMSLWSCETDVINLFFIFIFFSRRANRGRVNCPAFRLHSDGKKKCLNKLNLGKSNREAPALLSFQPSLVGLPGQVPLPLGDSDVLGEP